MPLREILRFEFLYQARQVRTWLYFAVLFAAAFLLMRTAGAGDGVINTPYAIAQQASLTLVLWCLMAPAVAGTAAARDEETRMSPLLHAAPIGKTDYLAGRYLAALTLNAAILLAVPFGILTAIYLPGLDPGTTGPLQPVPYLAAYGVIALPAAFTFTAVQFAAALWKRKALVSYVATVLFIIAATLLTALFVHVLHMPAFGQLLDPACRMNILNILPATLTAEELRTVVVGLDGTTLANRLLWIILSTALLFFTRARFRFGHREP